MSSSDSNIPRLAKFFGKLTLRSNVVHQEVPIKIISQNPRSAPTFCPHCGTKMLDHLLEQDDRAKYFVRTCPKHPYEGWNTSKLHEEES
jgi:hypothetical protein